MVEVYAVGICYLSVCSDETLDKITEHINANHSTGIQSKWKKHDGQFKTGEDNPSPCEINKDRKHYLFSC